MYDVQASGALKRYGVHAVVANILTTRKEQVQLVQQGSGDQPEVAVINRPPEVPFIEQVLVQRIVEMHTSFVSAAVATKQTPS